MKSVLMLIAIAGCAKAPVADESGAFYAWDNRPVHCAAEIDDDDGIPLDSIFGGMDRAARDGSVLELLVHRPGVTRSRDDLNAILDGAVARGLAFMTARDMLDAHPAGGVALMFDDAYPDIWLGVQDLLAAHGARVTLYITWYHRISQAQRDQIRQLADLGHDIEAHSVDHVRGPDYVEAHGLTAYMRDQVVPSFEALREDGYDPISYAYPFGLRTKEMDDAILASGTAKTVRALVQPNPARGSTCPD